MCVSNITFLHYAIANANGIVWDWDISNMLATKIPKLSHLIHWAIDVDSRSAATFRTIPPTILNNVAQQPNTHSKSGQQSFNKTPSNISVNTEPVHGPALIGDSNIVMTSWNGNIFRVTGLLWVKPLVTGGFPSQRPVTQSVDVSFDLCLNKRMSKQSRRRWFDTPSRSLWRHCNVRAYWWAIGGSVH